jgi:PIF1-like helicase
LCLLTLGEAGVGKSWAIKGIMAGMDLLSRKNEVIVMGPTGTAADNIGGSTCHTALGIGIGKKQKPDVAPRVKRLWAKKTIMVIDEVSMVSLDTLALINRQCKAAKAQAVTSPDLFGGLPIVIFMGDFFQFCLVRGRALWQDPRPGNEDDATGRLIWQRFNNVVILDQ